MEFVELMGLFIQYVVPVIITALGGYFVAKLSKQQTNIETEQKKIRTQALSNTELLSTLTDQFKPNGGSSVKDQLNKIEKMVSDHLIESARDSENLKNLEKDLEIHLNDSKPVIQQTHELTRTVSVLEDRVSNLARFKRWFHR